MFLFFFIIIGECLHLSYFTHVQLCIICMWIRNVVFFVAYPTLPESGVTVRDKPLLTATLEQLGLSALLKDTSTDFSPGRRFKPETFRLLAQSAYPLGYLPYSVILQAYILSGILLGSPLAVAKAAATLPGVHTKQYIKQNDIIQNINRQEQLKDRTTYIKMSLHAFICITIEIDRFTSINEHWSTGIRQKWHHSPPYMVYMKRMAKYIALPYWDLEEL